MTAIAVTPARVPSADKVALLRVLPSGQVQARSSDGVTIYNVCPDLLPARSNPSCTCPAGVAGRQCYHWRCARAKFRPDLPTLNAALTITGPRFPASTEAAAVAEAVAVVSAAATSKPTAEPDELTQYHRAQALAIAATLCQGQPVELGDLITVAQHLQAYITTGSLPG